MSTLNKNKALSFEKVSVQFESKVVLDNLSVVLEPETIYTVIGPSGTGKSTFLKAIGGLTPITKGKLSYNGKKYQPQDHIIGLVPQNYGLLPWQTAWQSVVQNVKISEKMKKITPQRIAEIQQLFELMEIGSVKDAYPKEMSGGQQQRVSIARAFAIVADFLLMDEPFSALDAFTREKIQQLFVTTWQNNPRTTLFITHDIEEALLLGEKIILLAGQPGEIKEVMANPLYSLGGSLEEKRENPLFFEWTKKLRREIQNYGQ